MASLVSCLYSVPSCSSLPPCPSLPSCPGITFCPGPLPVPSSQPAPASPSALASQSVPASPPVLASQDTDPHVHRLFSPACRDIGMAYFTDAQALLDPWLCAGSGPGDIFPRRCWGTRTGAGMLRHLSMEHRAAPAGWGLLFWLQLLWPVVWAGTMCAESDGAALTGQHRCGVRHQGLGCFQERRPG